MTQPQSHTLQTRPRKLLSDLLPIYFQAQTCHTWDIARGKTSDTVPFITGDPRHLFDLTYLCTYVLTVLR